MASDIVSLDIHTELASNRLADGPLQHVLKYQLYGDGVIVELGTGHGLTSKLIASNLHDGRELHTFDWFQGRPEAWRDRYGEGQHNRDGHAPLQLPPNVVVHAGLFEETLPPFIQQQTKIALLFVDCESYASTWEALSILAPALHTGSIIVFNQFINYDGYENHELKAFVEFLQTYGKSHHTIGMYGKIKKASKRKTSDPGNQKAAFYIYNAGNVPLTKPAVRAVRADLLSYSDVSEFEISDTEVTLSSVSFDVESFEMEVDSPTTGKRKKRFSLRNPFKKSGKSITDENADENTDQTDENEKKIRDSSPTGVDISSLNDSPNERRKKRFSLRNPLKRSKKKESDADDSQSIVSSLTSNLSLKSEKKAIKAEKIEAKKAIKAEKIEVKKVIKAEKIEVKKAIKAEKAEKREVAKIAKVEKQEVKKATKAEKRETKKAIKNGVKSELPEIADNVVLSAVPQSLKSESVMSLGSVTGLETESMNELLTLDVDREVNMVKTMRARKPQLPAVSIDKGNKKIKLVVVYNRRQYFECLLFYILRELNAFDEVVIWKNTRNAKDLAFLDTILSVLKDEGLDSKFKPVNPNKANGKQSGVYPLYRTCNEQDTLYIKIDDDVVWIAPNGFSNLINFALTNEHKYIMFSGNLVNSGPLDVIHQQQGASIDKIEFKAVRPFTKLLTSDGARQVHESLQQAVVAGTTDKYHVDHVFASSERWSINCVAFFGNLFNEPDRKALEQGDERYITRKLCLVKNKRIAVAGEALMAHYSFQAQRTKAKLPGRSGLSSFGKERDLLNKYVEWAHQAVE
jgi:methyltransferase family protein